MSSERNRNVANHDEGDKGQENEGDGMPYRMTEIVRSACAFEIHISFIQQAILLVAHRPQPPSGFRP